MGTLSQLKPNLAIVVTYNAQRWIERCLTSLSADDLVEILVIDNCSVDRTLDIIRDNYNHVTLMSLSSNIGFARANNIGFNYALEKGFDIVFLVNQDVYVNEKSIKQMLVNLHRFPDFIHSSFHMNSGGIYDKNFRENVERNGYQINENIDEMLFMDFVPAAFWCLHIDLIKKLGSFSEFFFMYKEDNNYCDRLRYVGGSVCVSTSCSIIHDREVRQGRPSVGNSLILVRSELVRTYLDLNTAFYLVVIRLARLMLQPIKFRDRGKLIAFLVINAVPLYTERNKSRRNLKRWQS